MRQRGSKERAVIDVGAHSNLMFTVPVHLGELERGNGLELLATTRPLVEIVSAVSLRRDEHIFRALAVGVAIEAHVLRDDSKDCTGAELIFVIQAERDSALVQVVGSAERNES